MARKQTIPIIGGSAKDKAISVNNQFTQNMMLAKKSFGAKNEVVLESIPGRRELGSAGDGACRTKKLLPWKGLLYGVFGTKLVSISDAYVVTEIGTLNSTIDTVIMARGRDYLFIVDGTDGYTYNGTTFAAVSDADFPGVSAGSAPTHCSYIDGAFIVHDPSNDNFYRSDAENPTSWNALSFEAASVSPDAVLANVATESILYILGETTTQPYYNDGNPDFPYTVYLSGVAEVGIAAKYSVAESDDGIFFLATTPEGGLFVYRMIGTEGMVISGDEQDIQFLNLTTYDNAVGFIYKQAGKSFYVLQFPSDGLTFVYNITMQSWENRSTYGSNWDAGGHGVINNKNIVGSISDAKFYLLDLSHYSDGNYELIRTRRTQVIHSNNQNINYDEFIVDFDPGVGIASGQGEDPQCLLRYSNDSGGSWSSWLQAGIGKQGEYSARARFTKLGSGRNRVWEIKVSAPVNVVIKGAFAVITVLDD